MVPLTVPCTKALAVTQYANGFTEIGSVWESNPQRALFKPATGFEDQGPHQRCKHSQGLPKSLYGPEIARKDAPRAVRGHSPVHRLGRRKRDSRSHGEPCRVPPATSSRQAEDTRGP